MRGKAFTMVLATALMSAVALPSSAASDYDVGLVKTVDRTSAAEQSDGFYQVGDRGKGGHKGRGHHRGGRDRGHRGHRGHRGNYRRHGYYKPRYRAYGGPYRYRRGYYYDDYVGAFVLGGVLGAILSDGYYIYE